MDHETREMLEHTLELARENNKMLRQVGGVQKREAIWRTLKALIAIALAFGLFYYVQPYVDKVMQFYSSILGVGNSIQGGSIDSLLKGLNTKEMPR